MKATLPRARFYYENTVLSAEKNPDAGDGYERC